LRRGGDGDLLVEKTAGPPVCYSGEGFSRVMPGFPHVSRPTAGCDADQDNEVEEAG